MSRLPLRSLLPVCAIGVAVAIAACDAPTAPSAPVARARPDSTPRAIVGIGFGYAATQLPLLPAGINDSGVIAGTVAGASGSDVARYANGVLTVLPRVKGVGGDYEARAINAAGAMAGDIAFGRGLFWRKPAQVPYQLISPSNGTVIPFGLNDSNVVVGSFSVPVGGGITNTHAFRWTTFGGLVDITPPGYQFAAALDVNDAGYAVGYGWLPGGHVQALRWNPAGVATVLVGDEAMAIAENGDAIGAADGFATTRRWTLAGQYSPLAGPQASNPSDISVPGRIVGWTYAYASINPHRPWTVFNGATTWLPVPNAASVQNVVDLRVNACGTIIGTRIDNSGAMTGLMWSKFWCDIGVVAAP